MLRHQGSFIIPLHNLQPRCPSTAGARWTGRPRLGGGFCSERAPSPHRDGQGEQRVAPRAPNPPPGAPLPQAPTSSNSSLASRRVETSNFPPPAVPPFPFCISMAGAGGKGGRAAPIQGALPQRSPPFLLSDPPPPSSSSWWWGVNGKYPTSGAPPRSCTGVEEAGATPVCSSGASPRTGEGGGQEDGELPPLSRGGGAAL